MEMLLRSLAEASTPPAAAVHAGGASEPAPSTVAAAALSAAVLGNIVRGLGSAPNLHHLIAYRSKTQAADPADCAAPTRDLAPTSAYPHRPATRSIDSGCRVVEVR
jgi:hypothetical protein